jgi:DNA-binding transcriptional ArsR family regulator
VFEVVAELAAFTSGPARASLDAGKAWIREVRTLAGRELAGRVECHALGTFGELVPIALEAGPPYDVDDLVARVRSMDPEAFRWRLLGADSPMGRSMVPEGTFEGAAAGDPAAVAVIREAHGADRSLRASVDRILAGPATAIREEFAALIADWHERVSTGLLPAAMDVLDREVAMKEAAIGRRSGRDVFLATTNAVSYDRPAWVDEIVLIPAVAIRPFIIPTDVGRTAIFLCSASDDAFDVDGAAPPRRLVKVAAALGDELRLRVLRLLRDEELSASEIADRLGVDRTSVHHHLGILRSAGLLAIHDEGVRGWRYAIRVDGIREIGPSFEAYLGVAGTEQPDRSGRPPGPDQ